jgi:Polyphosphate kinase 2 (PPK2)
MLPSHLKGGTEATTDRAARGPHETLKYNPGDVDERAYLDDYQHAYTDAFIKCNTEAAPWYAVSADRRWYRNWAVTKILAEQRAEMALAWPTPKAGTSKRNARGWQPTRDRPPAVGTNYVVLTSLLVRPFFIPSGPIFGDNRSRTITSGRWCGARAGWLRPRSTMNDRSVERTGMSLLTLESVRLVDRLN